MYVIFLLFFLTYIIFLKKNYKYFFFQKKNWISLQIRIFALDRVHDSCFG